MEQLEVLKPALVFLIVTLLGMLGGLIGVILFKDATAITLGVGAVGVHQIYRQTVGNNSKIDNSDK